MKTVKIFSCLVLASLFTSVNAQLRVLSDGRVQMGQNVPSLDPEKVATLLVLGSNDKIGTGAIIALGDSNFVFNTNLRVNGVNITSDARMKDNIQPIENPIDILSRLVSVTVLEE